MKSTAARGAATGEVLIMSTGASVIHTHTACVRENGVCGKQLMVCSDCVDDGHRSH